MSDGEGLTYKRPVRCGCGQNGCPRCRLEIAAGGIKHLVAEARVAKAAGAEIRSTVGDILRRAGL